MEPFSYPERTRICWQWGWVGRDGCVERTWVSCLCCLLTHKSRRRRGANPPPRAPPAPDFSAMPHSTICTSCVSASSELRVLQGQSPSACWSSRRQDPGGDSQFHQISYHSLHVLNMSGILLSTSFLPLPLPLSPHIYKVSCHLSGILEEGSKQSAILPRSRLPFNNKTDYRAQR